MSLFRRLSTKKKSQSARASATSDELGAGDSSGEASTGASTDSQGANAEESMGVLDSNGGHVGDGNDDDDDRVPEEGSRLRRTKTKKGVLRRVFSFKRSTSTTDFEPAAPKEEDVTGLPEMEIAWKTNLGFHHEENEDKATVVEDLFREFPPTHDKPYVGTPEQKLSVFAVYDGHGGVDASQWAQDHLHQHLSDLLWSSNYDDRIASGLHHSFKQTENDFCAWAKKKKNTAGSCATCVVIKGDKLFCGNAGDSKAMVVRQLRKQTPKAAGRTDLNYRHGSHLKSERVRIKKAGGRIASDGSVYGVLFPTRGFGDIDVKADGRPVVICTPDGAGFDKWEPYTLDHSAISYLIIASDGLWDFVSDKGVEAITMKHQVPGKIATELIKEARMGESEDDITVIVIRMTFPSVSKQPSSSQLQPVEE